MAEHNWLERWKNNDIPFHLTSINPLLEKYWQQLQLPKNANVLVPLCGKTLDLLWLAQQGYHAVGAELSEIACEMFFTENNIPFNKGIKQYFCHYVSENIEIYCGDFFQLTANILPKISAVYDRAALIALPEKLRQNYTQHLTNFLDKNGKVLLLVMDTEDLVQGPPYPVAVGEIEKLFPNYTIEKLARIEKTEISAHLSQNGYKKVDDVVYLLQKK